MEFDTFVGEKMKIAKREMASALILAVFVASLAAYTNNLTVSNSYTFGTASPDHRLLSQEGETNQHAKQMMETIEGELKKGTFEAVIAQLEDLTDEKGGFVYSLYMTYRDELWKGEVISKIPQDNMSSFVFQTRAIIEANGTVISITTSIISVPEDTQEEIPYATINIALRETFGTETPQPIAQVLSVVPWLITSLVWIAEGLIIGVPLCFVFLGVVLLVNRGIIPVWKKQLKKLR